MYKPNLRATVIIVSLISAVWAILWAISFFRDIQIYKDNNAPHIATFSLILGILYIGSSVLDLVGIVAAVTQRAAIVRLNIGAAIISYIMLVVVGVLRVVLHFMFKNEILNACETITHEDGVKFSFGLFGSVVKENFTEEQADNFCSDGWHKDTASEIVSLVFELFSGLFFIVTVISYARQVRSGADVRNTAPLDENTTYPSTRYQPPFLSNSRGNYAPTSTYAPPPGPLPSIPYTGYDDSEVLLKSGEDEYDVNKPPGYGNYGLQAGARDLRQEDKDDPFTDFEERL